MNLIRCTAAQCEAMAAVHAEAFPASWRWDEFEDLLDGAGIYGFLASSDRDGAPLGVILCRVAAGEMEVLTIGVAHDARRRGVAKALIAAALPAARDLGASECFLEVAVDNDPAIALYEGLGFRRAGLRKAYYDRRPVGFVDALVMRLDLNAAPQ
ncbi:MAG: GNAT family N-acetyltransferase [Proteobacteria bacterium]|nr:GNAT family N-acetyltransferase [Pseudomonadota bacterium]